MAEALMQENEESKTRPGQPMGLKGFLEAAPKDLGRISRERLLSLSDEEMSVIQGHFRKIGRNPSEAELETLAQTWSEHCKHKTFRAAIEHIEKDEMGMERRRRYGDLLKETIMKVTDELRRPWCLSVFKDNAGIVCFDSKTALAFKVETHNHPSALEPYGGAGTGLGGVIRDVLGAGLGAKPIANTDVFCFAPLKEKAGEAEPGVLSTRRIFRGVVSGVRDYGNRMGIPTVSGSVCFHEGFRQNPLVFCGTLGIMSPADVAKEVRPGDKIVMAGGRVGRDGIHGATFSSDALSAGIPSSVVQIGNPIVQKKLMDVLLQARDLKLYSSVTDCGAGGLSSAVGEMGETTGAEVRLDEVPLKYAGLAPWEIWLSESQERMVLAVPPENWPRLQQVFAAEDVECADIGTFTGDGHLRVRHGDEVVVDLGMDFLHDGTPKRHLHSVWSPPENPGERTRPTADTHDALLGVLAQPTVASKEWIIRQYDHEVQGRTVMKPLAGPRLVGPSDAIALQLDPNSYAGVLLAGGLNPRYSRWDAYWMAASALDEALRNLIAAGARLDQISLLDNFCAGDPQDPRILGEVVRAAQACYDMARVYGTPFISGKDSLNNQYVDRQGHKHNIPTTLLISAMAWTDDIRCLVTVDFKEPGHWIYVLGQTNDELGGSQYGSWLQQDFGFVPRVDPSDTVPLYEKLSEAIARGWVASCHDCSEGGLGVALAEAALAGDLGCHVDLRKMPVSPEIREQGRTNEALFSESNGRFVVTVPSRQRRWFAEQFTGLAIACVGQVREEARVRVTGFDGKTISWSLSEIEKSWTNGLVP